jgi:hypothetical protein
MLWHRRAGVQSQGVGVSLPGSAMALAVHACGQAWRRVLPRMGQRTGPTGGAASAAQPTLSPLLSRLAPGRAAPTPSRRRCVGGRGGPRPVSRQCAGRVASNSHCSASSAAARAQSPRVGRRPGGAHAPTGSR